MATESFFNYYSVVRFSQLLQIKRGMAAGALYKRIQIYANQMSIPSLM
jgi:hypothetical protein